MTTYRTHCYGEPVADYPTEAEAKAALTEHIQQTCPHGSMEWADPIKWGRIGNIHSRLGVPMTPGWVTSAKGEWLDHRIDEIEPRRERQDWMDDRETHHPHCELAVTHGHSGPCTCATEDAEDEARRP